MAPCPGSYKINYNSPLSIKLNFGFDTFVVRDSEGSFITGDIASFFCRSFILAEAMAIKMAVNYACSLQPYPIQIESDCKVIGNAIYDPLKLVD